jgi:hypothetical protein
MGERSGEVTMREAARLSCKAACYAPGVERAEQAEQAEQAEMGCAEENIVAPFCRLHALIHTMSKLTVTSDVSPFIRI